MHRAIFTHAKKTSKILVFPDPLPERWEASRLNATALSLPPERLQDTTTAMQRRLDESRDELDASRRGNEALQSSLDRAVHDSGVLKRTCLAVRRQLPFPTSGLVYNYRFDIESGAWTDWLDGLAPYWIVR
jgi:hypothetical protein